MYNGIVIGSEFKESTLIKYLQSELRKISRYLSGADNQGKAYATISFKNSQGEEERWKIETVDLKYKEYIDALISYDKRADEVLLSSVGLDSSISSVSKDGVISKSGADAYYNYLIYIMSLTSEDEICSEPFNMAIQINFPHLLQPGVPSWILSRSPGTPGRCFTSKQTKSATVMRILEDCLPPFQNFGSMLPMQRAMSLSTSSIRLPFLRKSRWLSSLPKMSTPI